ncbi:PaaI family thioesterase [Hoyosella rhizosphaerae]|uniref:Phenylacetic acid degradation protein n=1 Tax=Hoyosella rhizosphaerae TaxID=1755582 RepID=A0A916XEK9_9ACTN|nr:PaaI family thioesterase [Hoyosella rhizosphaerae]MBN4927401.1 PaaI family thioesterase [Hoyosella rhizosphaerae]GGC64709.1 phenylacetic acid degradation protein [Hoyosella rhizosphaerae]
MAEKSRQRQYSWSDPHATHGQHVSLSGLDFISSLARGEIDHSPAAHTLGFRVTKAESGSATIDLTPSEYHYNAVGSVHGGILTSILDSAMGFAISTTLPPGVGYTSLDVTVQFIRAVTESTGTITATGTAQHTGKTTATALGEIRDSTDRLIATATTRCMLFPAKE